jgi:hypothetical protein
MRDLILFSSNPRSFKNLISKVLALLTISGFIPVIRISSAYLITGR